MEKLIYLSTDERARELEQHAAELRAGAFGLFGATLYVCEAASSRERSLWSGVRAVLCAFIPCLDRRAALEGWLARSGLGFHGYLATESVPLSGSVTSESRLFLLRRPESLSDSAWLWAFEQRFGRADALRLAATRYARNVIVRPLALDAPALAGLVEASPGLARGAQSELTSAPDAQDAASAWAARHLVELYARRVASFGARLISRP